MSSEIAPQGLSALEVFRARMADRIASEMGEAMPTEVIAELTREAITGHIEKGMSKAVIYGDSDGWIRKLLTEQVAKVVNDEVTRLLTENSALVEDAVREALVNAIPKAITKAVMGHTEMKIWDAMQRFKEQLRS